MDVTYEELVIQSCVSFINSFIRNYGVMDITSQGLKDPILVYEKLDESIQKVCRPFIFERKAYIIYMPFFEKLKEEMPDGTNTDL